MLLQLVPVMGTFVSEMELSRLRDESRSASTECGVPWLMTAGDGGMPKLPVDSWDILALVGLSIEV